MITANLNTSDSTVKRVLFMTNPNSLKLDLSEDKRLTETRIRIKIPKKHYQEPVISRLISRHHLEVNIKAALLGENVRDDGWFDLQLRGHYADINDALIDLSELDVEVWHDSDSSPDGW
jgi:hypothetical protein